MSCARVLRQEAYIAGEMEFLKNILCRTSQCKAIRSWVKHGRSQAALEEVEAQPLRQKPRSLGPIPAEVGEADWHEHAIAKKMPFCKLPELSVQGSSDSKVEKNAKSLCQFSICGWMIDMSISGFRLRS